MVSPATRSTSMKRSMLVPDERDRRLAGEGRGDAQLRLFARRIVGLVERHDDVVGRVGAGRPRPADVEQHARLLALERLDVEPVRAPADGRGNLGRRVGGNVDRSARHALRRLDRLEAPAAVGIEPLIVVRHLVERPFGALARDARAVRRDRDRFEGGDVACARATRRNPSSRRPSRPWRAPAASPCARPSGRRARRRRR